MQSVCGETREDEPSWSRKYRRLVVQIREDPKSPKGGAEGCTFSHREQGFIDELVAVWYMVKVTLEEDLLS